MPKDPICGMEVDEKKARFITIKDGKKYYFCSNNCYDTFLNQNKYPISKKALNEKQIEEKSIKNNKIETKKESEITKKIILPIRGMHCASCALNIEKKLKSGQGVASAEVSYAAG